MATMINSCYREARNYLNSRDDFNSIDVKSFVDEFNNVINNYLDNGISSFLLNCVDISNILAQRIGYANGVKKSTVLKAEMLSLGGYYSLAANYYQSINPEVENELRANYFRNMIYSGEIQSSNIIEPYNISNSIESDFFRSYNKSIDLLKISKDSSKLDHEELISILSGLDGRNSFFHYIDGLLNLAEIYLNLNELDRAKNVLDQVNMEKRELKIVECRFYRLLTRYGFLTDDFNLVNEYKGLFNKSIKRCTVLKGSNCIL